ncbi:putative F-box protein [Arabidopsis thaliana]
MDIWVTNKIDDTTDWSWSKFFTVRLINRLDYPISMMKKSPLSFFIDEKKNIILCYDKHRENTYKSLVLIVGKDKVYREFYFPESYVLGRTYLCNYVPSLVQIKQSGLISTRKRKRKDFSS